MAKFEIFLSEKDNQYYFHLKADNGEIILASEGYTEKSNARHGIESVKKNAPNKRQYEIVWTADRQYWFNLLATNGQVIGVSESYVDLNNMNEGAARVESYAPKAEVVDLTA